MKGVTTPPLTFEGHYTPLYNQPNTFSAYCIRSYSLIYSLPITDSFSLYPQIHRTKHSSFSKYGSPHPASPHPGYTIPLPKSNQTHPKGQGTVAQASSGGFTGSKSAARERSAVRGDRAKGAEWQRASFGLAFATHNQRHLQAVRA